MDALLMECASLVQAVSSDWDDQQQRHLLLLEALVNMTLEDPAKASEGFTTLDLHQAVSELLNKNWGEIDAAAKTVSKAWKKLEVLWARKEEGLRQRALDKGLAGYPKITKKQGGGGGHSSRYYLTYKAFSDESQTAPFQASDSKDDVVRYYLDDLKNPGRVASTLSKGFLLNGWRKGIFLSLMLFVITALVLLAWFLLAVILRLDNIGQLVVILGGGSTIFWVLWKVIGPFVRILDWKVAVAPDWLQPSKGACDRLLIFQREMPEAPNKIILARYNAKCSACHGNLIVKRGGLEFPNRLVGRCEYSPREHVFSFDHFLRIGKPLRD